MAFVFNPFTGNFDVADTVTFSPPAVDLTPYEKKTDSENRDQDLQDQIDALPPPADLDPYETKADSEKRDKDLQDQIDALPPPADLKDYETKADSEAGDQNLQAQIDALPPPPDLDPYETKADSEARDQNLQDQIDALGTGVPPGGGGGSVDLSDYATIVYVDDSIAAIPPTDLSDYATEQYVDDSIAAIPPTDLTGLATEQYVDDSIAAIPPTDLSDYAKTEYVDDEIEAAGDAAEKYTDAAIAKLPPGMKAGGKTGQILAKKTDVDYVTEWIDANSGSVSVQETPPVNPDTGALWFDSKEAALTLYLFTGIEWVPAAPPVSLDGINATINAALDVQNDLLNRVQEGEEEQSRQSSEIQALQEKFNDVQKEYSPGKWTFVTKNPGIGQYALTVEVTSEYCQDVYLKCIDEANEDPAEIQKCNRLSSECNTAKDNGENFYVDHWGGVNHISINVEEADGEIHSFADYSAGKFLKVMNEANGGHGGNAIYQIVENAVITDGVAVIPISVIQHTGKPNGPGFLSPVFSYRKESP